MWNKQLVCLWQSKPVPHRSSSLFDHDSSMALLYSIFCFFFSIASDYSASASSNRLYIYIYSHTFMSKTWTSRWRCMVLCGATDEYILYTLCVCIPCIRLPGSILFFLFCFRTREVTIISMWLLFVVRASFRILFKNWTCWCPIDSARLGMD